MSEKYHKVGNGFTSLFSIEDLTNSDFDSGGEADNRLYLVFFESQKQ